MGTPFNNNPLMARYRSPFKLLIFQLVKAKAIPINPRMKITILEK